MTSGIFREYKYTVMDLPLNHNKPLTMHVDLNSCFATVEQQANPLLRGKPIVVAAYNQLNGCVLAPSIEAKTFGIKTGMQVREAKLLCPAVIVRTPDPDKYFDVHIKFRKIFNDYSPDVFPKSIDEVVVDFSNVENLHVDLVRVGKEIKQRIRNDVGEWMRCNIGIATNRFLAKLAASLHKPDGLDVITHENLKDVYNSVRLVDLHGINVRFEARLNAAGIFTPLEFLATPIDILAKEVFKSIVGRYWYQRLRGYEIDDVEFGRKSIGQDYALKKPTTDIHALSRLLMKLCEKMGRRLRKMGYIAHGIHVFCAYNDYGFWHRARKMETELYSTSQLYQKALLVFNQQPQRKPIVKLSVSCYDLTTADKSQMSLFEDDIPKQRKVSDALDQINDRWGEFVITPALMMDMKDLILKRVAFGGSTKELEDLYA